MALSTGLANAIVGLKDTSLAVCHQVTAVLAVYSAGARNVDLPLLAQFLASAGGGVNFEACLAGGAGQGGRVRTSQTV